MVKRALFGGILLVFLGAAAQAFPGNTGEASSKALPNGKFTAADTNKDGFLSRKEFAAAFPGLKPEAFDLIDKDGDGKVSAVEWGAFSMGHGGTPMPPPPVPAKEEALPVVPSPKGPQESRESGK